MMTVMSENCRVWSPINSRQLCPKAIVDFIVLICINIQENNSWHTLMHIHIIITIIIIIIIFTIVVINKNKRIIDHKHYNKIKTKLYRIALRMVKLECIMFVGLFKLFNSFNITHAQLKRTKTKLWSTLSQQSFLLQYKKCTKSFYNIFAYLGD